MTQDYVVRAITEDGAFRIIAAHTTHLVTEAIERQGATGETARLFGELLTGTLLTRETMAPSLRLQAFVMIDGAGTLTGDSHPDGLTRGLVSLERGGRPSLTKRSYLRVTRALPNHELHEGIVTAESEYGLSGAFANYMLQSEQVESTVGIAASLEGGRVVSAGGFIVQLLPEATPESTARMAKHLEAYYDPSALIAETHGEPKAMLPKLLDGIPFVMLEESPVHFGCTCSEVRVLSALAALDRAEIKDMVDRRESIETDCDYCKTHYSVSPRQLASLLEVPS